MHYKNGRTAKNGDKVVRLDPYTKAVTVGILYDAQPGNDHCNGQLAPIGSGNFCPNLQECVHYDDFVKGLPAEFPDTSKP